MYIDSSRIRTMARIQSDLDDPTTPMWRKKKAYRLKTKIQKELKDPTLARMRERLTIAASNNDKYEMWKLTCQIKDYMKEEIPVDIYE